MQKHIRSTSSPLTLTCHSTAARPLMACLILAPCESQDSQQDDVREARWLSACRHLTPLVERASPQCALLDLGACAEREAQAAMQTLMRRMAHLGFQAQVGIAPSLMLAQLAALTATPAQPLVLLTPDIAQAFLRDVPVATLLHLWPPDRVTPEIVERLERYGLRTLGHLARLGESALRRQFGVTGGFLATVAAGRDERPLHPTPPPTEYRARVRLGSGASPDRVLAALGPFSERMAAYLRGHGRQARALRARVRWECGCVQGVRLTLRQHTNDPVVLAQELRRLVISLLQAHRACAEGDSAHPQTLDGLWIALGDFTPVVPGQATFWRTREQRHAAARLVADTLVRRHGQPLLLRLEPVKPAAIFDEECHRLATLPTSAPARTVQHKWRQVAAPADPWQAVPRRLHWW